MGARISKDKALVVLDAYKKGLKWKQCAKIVGISITSVKRILDDAGLERKREKGAPEGCYRVNFDVNDAYQDYCSGMKLADMTAKHKASAQLIWQRMLKHGYKPKRRRVVKEKRAA
jgi:hypothetical protein